MTVRLARSGEVFLADESIVADVNNPMDILGWLNDSLDLEDGITFVEIVRCLAPWGTAVSHIVHCDFAAISARCLEEVPDDGVLVRENYVGVEIAPYIVVDRDEDEPIANVSIEWNAFGRLGAPLVSLGHSSDVIGLSLRHPAEYAHLPVRIVREAQVSDIMTGGIHAPWNMEPVIHASADGTVRSFSVMPTVVETLLYGLFSEVRNAGSGDHAKAVSKSVAEMLDRYA